MSKFWRLSPWITRLILLFPATIFVRIGVRGVANIAAAIGERGLVFTSGNGATIARVGFGAFPLACGLFILGCMVFESCLPAALGLVLTMDVLVLIVRVVGMYADSSVAENMHLVRAEVLLFFLTSAGIVIEFLRRRRGDHAKLSSATVSG